MVQQFDFQLIQMLYTDARFESLWRALDKLHDAASEGQLADVTPLAPKEVTEWLREIVFTAQETIHEIEAKSWAQQEPDYGTCLKIEDLRPMQERRLNHVTVKAGIGSGGT